MYCYINAGLSLASGMDHQSEKRKMEEGSDYEPRMTKASRPAAPFNSEFQIKLKSGDEEEFILDKELCKQSNALKDLMEFDGEPINNLIHNAVNPNMFFYVNDFLKKMNRQHQ